MLIHLYYSISSGGAQFIAGKTLPNDNYEAAIIGAVSVLCIFIM
jgi:hypothetical protein